MLIGAGVAAVAIAVAVVLGVVLGGGSSHPANVASVGSLVNALPGAADVQALFKGIPQHGTTLGSASAPVTLVEFIDLQCPFCQEFETQTLPDIVAKYVRADKLDIVMHPWAFIGPDSVRGQAAVLAAAEQNKAFNLAEVLYDNQGTENTGWLNQSIVESAAASVPGLKVHELLNAMSSSAVRAGAQQVAQLVKTYGVTETPTIFVGKAGTRGTFVNMKSPTDEKTLTRAIEAAGG